MDALCRYRFASMVFACCFRMYHASGLGRPKAVFSKTVVSVFDLGRRGCRCHPRLFVPRGRNSRANSPTCPMVVCGSVSPSGPGTGDDSTWTWPLAKGLRKYGYCGRRCSRLCGRLGEGRPRPDDTILYWHSSLYSEHSRDMSGERVHGMGVRIVVRMLSHSPASYSSARQGRRVESDVLGRHGIRHFVGCDSGAASDVYSAVHLRDPVYGAGKKREGGSLLVVDSWSRTASESTTAVSLLPGRRQDVVQLQEHVVRIERKQQIVRALRRSGHRRRPRGRTQSNAS